MGHLVQEVNVLGARIAEMITAEGPLSVAQYMAMCLHDPQGGAYASRQTIGRDFITAPEISQTFGELCGLWAVQAWHDQGRPERPRLVELGPGRGTLMADALRAIRAAAPEYLKNSDVTLVESSPVLAEVQREKLKPFGVNIAWRERFDESLGDRPLFLLANEFFDCAPVRQFVRTPRGWCERMVIVKDDKLCFALAPMPVDMSVIPPDRAAAPDGGVYEIAPSALALAEEIASVVEYRGGVALVVDYGYDVPGFGETLQAVERGEFADALSHPGESDLSAHVDFAALARAARAGGAIVSGPVPQGEFLASLGIRPRAERLTSANPDRADELVTAVDRLVHPAKMGTLFKALAISPKLAPRPPGF
jgi:NADH dehydrogenase [ubiquinone] 1 alpha subcomplex assembly factor 7